MGKSLSELAKELSNRNSDHFIIRELAHENFDLTPLRHQIVYLRSESVGSVSALKLVRVQLVDDVVVSVPLAANRIRHREHLVQNWKKFGLEERHLFVECLASFHVVIHDEADMGADFRVVTRKEHIEGVTSV